jgi:peroxiredoxin
MTVPRVRFTMQGIIVAVVVVTVPGRASEDSPEARLAAITAALKANSQRYGAELQKVERTEAAQKPALDRFLAELRLNLGAALELAGAHPDDPVALEALKFVVRTNGSGPGDESARALRMILERGDTRVSGQGNYLAHVALRMWQYPDAETVLRRVLAENPNRDDRGKACYWLAHHLAQQAKMVRRFREDPAKIKDFEKYTAATPIDKFVEEKDPDALDEASLALLERVVAEFGDVRMDGETSDLGTKASGELFARRGLAVGEAVPEVEGTDHEGKTFKLSDFRGKVVVLTFSGNWCGPCVRMYPQERELVARLKGQPFALVSVSTDADVETLKKSITSGEITWRCWWDGGTSGPITTRWGITGFPSIFVLDKAGVMRFKDVRGDDLDKAVASLLGEAPGEVAPER